MDDGVVRVLSESSGSALLGTSLRNQFTGASVLPLQPACITNSREKEVVGKELHVGDFDVLVQVVNLDTAVIVDVDILFLGDSEVLVVVQPLSIPHSLTELQFTSQLATPPVHGRNMSLPASEQKILSVPGVILNIWPEAVELQLKSFLRSLDTNVACNVALSDLVCLFQLVLGLQESRRVFQKNFSILCLERRIVGSLVQCAEVCAQLLIPDTLDLDCLAAAILVVGFLLPLLEGNFVCA